MEALRVTIALPEGFAYYRLSPSDADLPTPNLVTVFNELFHQFAYLSSLRRHFAPLFSTGILTRYPSASAFAYTLGPD